MRALLRRAMSLASDDAHQQRNQEDHDKNEEQDLRDFRGAGRDAAEAEHGGDDRDDKENGCVSKHETSHHGSLKKRGGFGRDRNIDPSGRRRAPFEQTACLAIMHGDFS
jgi:hypothetical protein